MTDCLAIGETRTPPPAGSGVGAASLNTGTDVQSQDRPSSSDSEEIVITAIRATDVALGLRRLPAGFYAVICHGGGKYRTENKPSSVNGDVVEWSGPIPMALNMSATVRLQVYASFEFLPTLGTGELLRQLTVSVEQLLDRSVKEQAFVFFPEDEDVVSPCSSIFVECKWRSRGSYDSSALIPSTVESEEELENATNIGHRALSRYRKHGERRDLERSLRQFERALNMCPPGHPCRAAAQSNLAMVKFVLCQVRDADALLGESFRLYRNALAARPITHPDRPSTLVQLAMVHLLQFQKRKDDAEKAQVKALLQEVVQLSTAGSHEKQTADFILQVLVECELGFSNVGPENESLEQQALSKLFTGKELLDLGYLLKERFHQSGNLTDLQQAIGILEELLEHTSIQDGQYCAILEILGGALFSRFQHLGGLRDLEDAISKQREVLHLTPRGHHARTLSLHNLGTSLLVCFQRLGRSTNLEDAISTLREAADLTPNGHSDKPSILSNLGYAFRIRFRHLGRLTDLEHAFSILKDAINLTSDAHHAKPCLLDHLGSSYMDRFERLGQLTDLVDAISSYKDAIRLAPVGDSDSEGLCYLDHLGGSFFTYFRRFGQVTDLEDAISTARDVVELTPNGHPTKPGRLSSLGNSLVARFEHFGRLIDLEDGISILIDAVELTPNGHPEKPVHLNNLGKSFTVRFQHLSQLRDLEDSISALTDAVNLTPDGHPSKPICLSNLGYSLFDRFRHLGHLTDLDNAVSTLRNAVDITPDTHFEKPNHLTYLGYSCEARFEHLRSLHDLEDAISSYKAAFDLTPDGHFSKHHYLYNLGKSLLIRFKNFGELPDHEEGISNLRDAFHLLPNGHPSKPHYRHDIGTASLVRFEHFGQPADLEDAISSYLDAVDLTPDSDHYKSETLKSLGVSLCTRFEHLGQLTDLENAISRFKKAINILHGPNPILPALLDLLADCFKTRFERLGRFNDQEQAISLYAYAAFIPTRPIGDRFRAAQQWVTCARRVSHHSLLRAYSVMMDLFPQLAWNGHPLNTRYWILEQHNGSDIVREAAAAALDAGFPETAVEWLEQGRSIVWGELLQLRTSHEDLSVAYPDHARRLHELSAALESASATWEKSSSALGGGSRTFSDYHRFTAARKQHEHKAVMKQQFDNCRTLASQRDKLLHDIRRLPGFERFPSRKRFSQLRAAAYSGPVVILNAAENRCDALIVLTDLPHVIHVPLPSFTLKRLADLQNAMRGFARHMRDGRPVTWNHASWEILLAPMWKCVVKPVLDALAISVPGNLTRIFWCPTGPFSFLPIHAAGLYDSDHTELGHKVFDFVVSSYVPTLAILLPSRNLPVPTNGNLRLLAVRQPSSDGHPPLPGVDVELRYVKEVVMGCPSTEMAFIEPSVGAVDEVLGLMRNADWVHFACHGIQDGLDSGLCLADGRRLKLRDIHRLSRPRGGLAFLSACQTAKGEQHLSDEAMHMAAGMLFAGYGGVIGAMWSISDVLAPSVARDVYERLFRTGARPDYRDAAWALHEAVECLRARSASFSDWLPFIHVGL